MTEIDMVLTLTEAAKRAGVNLRTLERLRSVGEGPPILHLTVKRRGVLASDLDAWVLSRRRVPPGG